MIQHFLTTVALVINATRNRVDVDMKFRKRDGNRTSSFLTLSKNRSQSFPISLKQSIHLNSDAKLQIYLKNGEWIHFDVVVYLYHLQHIELAKPTMRSSC